MKNCLWCGKEFDPPQKELNRGNGKYCNQVCSARATGKSRVKKPKIPNVVCAWCGKKFYRNSTKQKNSKSGLQFCCRKHKDEAQRVGGIKEIQPPHYGDGSTSCVYRTLARRLLPRRCNRCGYDEVPQVLEVHHIDMNHSNNDISNLEVLCPTCHAIDYYLWRIAKASKTSNS